MFATKYGKYTVFITGLLKFHVLHRNRPALDQLIEGLKTGDIYSTIKGHSEEMERIFCFIPTQLTAGSMKSLFRPNFTETVSNKRAVENRIFGITYLIVKVRMQHSFSLRSNISFLSYTVLKFCL